MLNYGFEDPRRAFESLVTALQGELLDEEYNCLSGDFRERNGLSNQTYRAFRDEFLERYPRLRWALARARVDEVTRVDTRHALLRAHIPVPFLEDPVLTLTFVRETFWELAHDGRVLGGDQAELDPLAEGWLLLDEREPGRPRLWARFDLPYAMTPEDLALDFALAQGTEWHLDDFRIEG